MFSTLLKKCSFSRKSYAQILVIIALMSTIYIYFIGKGSYNTGSGLNVVSVLPLHLTDEQLDALPSESFSYLAIIDAGSSGCRAHLFRYGRLGQADGPVYVLPKHSSLKVKPGLSSFANKPEDAGKSLEPLVKFLKESVPEKFWENTPIWLKATAGLRLLPSDEIREAILNSVRLYLKQDSPFHFQYSYAHVISGKEEGALGWLAYNYLKKVVGPKRSPASDSSYAVVEMGGASSQVTQRAPTKDLAEKVPKDHLYSFTVGDENFDLYTYSYLGYGAEQARELLNKKLIAAVDKASSTVTVYDPCLNSGYSRSSETTVSSPYDGVDLTAANLGGSVVGTSNEESGDMCFRKLEHLFTSQEVAVTPDCSHMQTGKLRKNNAFSPPHSFNCVHQPSFVVDSLNFLVFENFFYTSSAANVLPANHAPGAESSTAEVVGSFPLLTTPLELKESAEEVCEMSYAQVMKRYPRDGQPKDVATKLCFTLSYSAAFLIYGLHIPEDKVITIQKDVNGSDIEWALGAAYRGAYDILQNSNNIRVGG